MHEGIEDGLGIGAILALADELSDYDEQPIIEESPKFIIEERRWQPNDIVLPLRNKHNERHKFPFAYYIRDLCSGVKTLDDPMDDESEFKEIDYSFLDKITTRLSKKENKPVDSI